MTDDPILTSLQHRSIHHKIGMQQIGTVEDPISVNNKATHTNLLLRRENVY